jgi:chitinase
MTLRMKSAAALVFFTLTFAFTSAHASNPRLLAYYEYADRYSTPPYDSSNIPYDKVTHIVHSNIAPAGAADGTLYVPPGFLDPKLISRAHAAGVKVEICVGGAPAAFVAIDADPALRTTFAQNIANFAIANGYDGVDFDYEVPETQGQADDFALLVADLRSFLPAGQYLISAAISSSPGSYGLYDFAGMTPYVDFYNVMTYDFHGPWTNHSGHNSPLYQSPLDPGQEGSLDTSTDEFLGLFGVPAEQINLGTAFYGYAFDLSGLWSFCPNRQLCGNAAVPTLTYAQIAQLISSGHWTENYDELSSAPYLTDADNVGYGFITYDNVKSSTDKVNYALGQRKLGGVFMWEISQDYDGHTQPLLDAMHGAMRSVLKQASRP